MANALPLSWQNEYEHDSQSMINNFHLPFSEPEYSAPKENHASTWQIEDNFLQQPNPAKYHEATYQTPSNTSQAPRVQQPPSFHSVPSNNPQVVRSPLDPHVQVHLHDLQLWDSFSAAQTEMIVTKTGRRMFPGYRVKMSGMDPNAQYCVLMDISSVDENRYKFQHGEWVIAGRGEPHIPQRFYLHPNSPCTGQQWMKDIVSFHKVKLTNSCGNSADGKFLIHSMHRYQPRLHIVRTDDVSTLHLQPMSTFIFPQTMFVTVTAYQNHEVTKLKINNNPFARGFRSNGGKTRNMLAQNQCELQIVEPSQPLEFSRKRIHQSQLGDDLAQMTKRWHGNSMYQPSFDSSPQPSWSSYQSLPAQLHYNTISPTMPLNEICYNQPTTQYYQQYVESPTIQLEPNHNAHFDLRPTQLNFEESPEISTHPESHSSQGSPYQQSMIATSSPTADEQVFNETTAGGTMVSFTPVENSIAHIQNPSGGVQVVDSFRSPLASTDEGYISTSLSNPDEEAKPTHDVLSTLNDILPTHTSPNSMVRLDSLSAEIPTEINCSYNILSSHSPIY
uniref:T-box domain-containing protein n=1 Tax=Ciona savignyi TaxID=51511 RepID=H2ZQG4_CIOSA